MEGERIPGVSRQQLKQLKAMPLPNFRRWLLEYTDIIYVSAIVPMPCTWSLDLAGSGSSV